MTIAGYADKLGDMFKLNSVVLKGLKVKKDGYLHPFYWTPFILVGEFK
ncbi:MAG: hypothetical protein WCJ75_14250 [Desulfomonile sp.]|jgi:CHAT domain-containing protein